MDEQTMKNVMESLRKAASEQTVKQAKHDQVCWFCNVEPPTVKEHWAGVHLEKVTSQSLHRRVSDVLDVLVPRCESCYHIHRRMSWVIRYTLIAFFAPIVLMILGIAPADKFPGFVDLMGYVMISGLVVAVLGTLLYHVTFPKHTHKRIYEHQYPAVLEAKRGGYLAFWGRIFHL